MIRPPHHMDQLDHATETLCMATRALEDFEDCLHKKYGATVENPLSIYRLTNSEKALLLEYRLQHKSAKTNWYEVNKSTQSRYLYR